MIEIQFYAVLVMVAAVWLISRAFIFWRHQQMNLKYELKIAFLFICCAVILRFTFFPFALADGHVQQLVLDFGEIYPFRLNLQPFVHLFDYEGSLRDTLINTIGNTVMFIPVGVILPLTFPKLSKIYKVLAAGFLVSLTIEIIQLPFASRVSDIDDLILNTVGTGIGFGCYYLVHRLRQRN